MAEKDTVKRYPKGDLIIEWRAEKCIHSRVCWHKLNGLPEVFKPAERPWIQPENATEERIREQIDKCPSGALAYVSASMPKTESESTAVEIMLNGPILMSGDVKIIHSNGEVEHKQGKVALCRCGKSNQKPFCDGEHRKVDFKG